MKMSKRTVSLSEGAGDPFTWGAASDACGSSGPDILATELCARGKGKSIYSACIVECRFGDVVVVGKWYSIYRVYGWLAVTKDVLFQEVGW